MRGLRRSRFIEQLGKTGLQRPRIGTIQNVRGAPLDCAFTHDRAPRPWHHLRRALRAAQNDVGAKANAGSNGTREAFARVRGILPIISAATQREMLKLSNDQKWEQQQGIATDTPTTYLQLSSKP